MNLLFESPAEEQAYPHIKKIAEILNKKVFTQYKIMEHQYFDWVLDKMEHSEWDENDAEEYERNTGKPIDYMFEKFRIDFFFLDLKTGIEIDGDKYHDTYNDMLRDKWLLEHRNIKIIHIKVSEVFNGKIEQILNHEFGIGQRNLNFY